MRPQDTKSPENETLQPITNTSKILRPGQNFPRPKFFEETFFTPFSALRTTYSRPPSGIYCPPEINQTRGQDQREHEHPVEDDNNDTLTFMRGLSMHSGRAVRVTFFFSYGS